MTNTVPEGWTSAPLTSFCDVVGGGTPDRSTLDYWNGNIPWASPSEITSRSSKYISATKESITRKGLEMSSAKLHPAGTVLMTSRASIGYVAINTVPMATNQGFQSLRCKDNALAEFMYQYVIWKRPELNKMSAGSTFSEISSSSVKKLTVTFPPLPEQKKIAAILSSVDDVIEKTQAQIDKLNDLKIGMMQELLAHGIGPNGKPHTEFKDSPVGRIPVDWVVTDLGRIAEFINGNSFNAQEWNESGLPIIRIQNLNGQRKFNYYQGEVNHKWLVNTGDLLFAWSGQRGKSFGARIWKGPRGVLNQHIFKVVPDDTVVMTSFLAVLLKSVQVDIERQAHGFKDSFMHVKKSDLTKHVVALPSFSEQRRIVKVIEGLSYRLSISADKLERYKYLKKGLMQDLLTGKVRVRVGQTEEETALA